MTLRPPPTLSIVVPCFNEEAALGTTNEVLLSLLERLVAADAIAPESAVCYVDDGSRDATWSRIRAFAAADPRVRGIRLSRNRGHQAALLAGLFNSPGDVVVSIDADLQDDPACIADMVLAYRQGSEIVFGVRASRESDTAFKRWTALAFYRLMQRLGVDLLHNHADFRLMSRRAIEALGEYREVNLFLRGLIPLMGFRTSTVRYDRCARTAGETKYPLSRMVAFALEGITSLSVVPLRLITLFGLLVSFLSLLMIAYVLYGTLVLKAVIPGWASVVLPIYFLGGVQTLCIGILGEYVSKIYLETKARPRYFIEETL